MDTAYLIYIVSLFTCSLGTGIVIPTMWMMSRKFAAMAFAVMSIPSALATYEGSNLLFRLHYMPESGFGLLFIICSIVSCGALAYTYARGAIHLFRQED